MPSLSNLTYGRSFLTPEVIQLFTRLNIRSVEDLIYADHKFVIEQSKVNKEEFLSFVNNLQQLYTPIPVNGKTMYNQFFENAAILSTGCESIDNLIGTGIVSGDLIELVGEPSTGKTQFAIATVISTVCQTEHSVIYIDTSNTFTAERAKEIFDYTFDKTKGKSFMSEEEYMESYESSKAECFSRILHYPVFDVFQLYDLLLSIQSVLQNQTTSSNDVISKKLRLIIIDSLGSLIGSILGGKQQSTSSSNFTMSLMVAISRLMKSLASQFNLAFMFTNYTVIGDKDGSKKAGLGYTWSFVPNIQLFFHSEITPENLIRTITVSKSTRKAVGTKLNFEITVEGLVDSSLSK